jgi:hypothetical protein
MNRFKIKFLYNFFYIIIYKLYNVLSFDYIHPFIPYYLFSPSFYKF